MKQAIVDFIHQELLNGLTPVDENSELLVSQLIDSLGVMRLVAFIEETFETTIPAQDLTLENFSTINTITHYLASQDSKKQAPI